MNEISCPELEELIKAFESMATVVKFANMSLHDGDLELARQNYVNALILFKKLGNDRGVSACRCGVFGLCNAELLLPGQSPPRYRVALVVCITCGWPILRLVHT